MNWRKASHSSTSNCVQAANWRKSRYSGPTGGNCVEAASFRKSSYSGGCSAMHECVEAGHGPGVVGVRDTKDRGHGPVLEFSPAAWRAFTAGLKSA